MPNVVLNKKSGYYGEIVVQVTPEAYIGKNDATKEVVFTNAKGTTAKLTCLFKGTGEYIYDNPVITKVIAPNFSVSGGTKQLQFKVIKYIEKLLMMMKLENWSLLKILLLMDLINIWKILMQYHLM